MSYEEEQRRRRQEVKKGLQSYKWPRHKWYQEREDYAKVFTKENKHLWKMDQLEGMLPFNFAKDCLGILYDYCEFEEAGINMDLNDTCVLIAGPLCFGCKIGWWVDECQSQRKLMHYPPGEQMWRLLT